ncbi:SGNH/GDSL hydrolase family protein [Variovorax sp. M-6]|uniref:SGNH/GDSL hydrolase family protein n=1 Tax=Variovorax sp. M-6 TaxID=3233041 RepID=UPI003F9DF668
MTFACVTLAGCGGGGADGTFSDMAPPPSASSKDSAVSMEAAKPPTACTIELYGDSIMAGNGSAETPAMTLQRVRPGLEVVADHSVAGMQLAALATVFSSEARSARIVVIENGVIDSWRGLPPNNFKAALEALIYQLRAEGRTPVLTGYSRQAPNAILSLEAIARRDAYDGLARSVAAAAGIEFANWGSVQFEGANDLLDGVHPNKDYSDRLVERLAVTLDKVAPECVPVQTESQVGETKP